MLKKVIKAILIINGILLIILLVIGFNHDLEVTEYTFESPKIPKAFDGFKIVQLSDLHDRSFGDDNEDLIEAIREIDPNLIVMTGDMIDAADKVIKDETATLFQELPFIADTYAVDGNHEDGSKLTDRLHFMYEIAGIHEITNKQVKIEKDGDAILLSGLSGYYPKYLKIEKADVNYQKMFNIALMHRVADFNNVEDYGFDIVLSGHAHGGVVRLPFVGGVISNDGGLWPEYTSGFYSNDLSTMLVSRGLGDMEVPRFNNRPEVICLTLKCAD